MQLNIGEFEGVQKLEAFKVWVKLVSHLIFFATKKMSQEKSSNGAQQCAIDSYDEINLTVARYNQPLDQLAGSSAGGLPKVAWRPWKLVHLGTDSRGPCTMYRNFLDILRLWSGLNPTFSNEYNFQLRQSYITEQRILDIFVSWSLPRN